MEEKYCPKCNLSKNIEDFSKRRSGSLNSYCKPCQREYGRLHYSKNKNEHIKRRVKNKKITRRTQAKKIAEIKNKNICVDCGINYPHYILEFDHISDNKLMNVSEMPGRFGWEKIQQEIDKCEIVCSNCHKERTWKRKQTGYS